MGTKLVKVAGKVRVQRTPDGKPKKRKGRKKAKRKKATTKPKRKKTTRQKKARKSSTCGKRSKKPCKKGQKLTGAAKAAFLARMAKGRKAKK